MNQTQKTYEAMFLVDAGNPDFGAASEPVRAVLDRYGADILSLTQWDERRLAYPIRGRKRGLYILSYFHVDPERISQIQHDCQLDERILRVLIVRQEHLTAPRAGAEATTTSRAHEPSEQESPPGDAAGESPNPPAAEQPAGTEAPADQQDRQEPEEIVELIPDDEIQAS